MGKTIMVSSHILPELADICNKIGIIEKGELTRQLRSSRTDEASPPASHFAHRRRRGQEAAAKLLEQHSAVENVEPVDGQLVVTLKDGIHDYSDLATLLVTNGHKLTLFKEDELNLEGAFMALTKGITA